MKLWGGIFDKEVDKLVENFTHSFKFDKILFKEDIKLNIAWTKCLKKCNILTAEEEKKIIKGLKEIGKEGVDKLNKNSEDIHTAIEEKLFNKIGELAGKLHTGRSRNDQISCEIRMYLKEEIKEIISLIKSVQKNILALAKKYLNVIIPGYTHFRPAQPILLSHYLLAYFFTLQRDIIRFQEVSQHTDIMPLGSSAISGSSFALDRKFLAESLLFKEITDNSVDGVSDRDFIIDFLSSSSILMMHFSRLSEELIIFSNPQFDFVEIPEEFCTGSSIMPQKKNPDVLEIIRGKTGRIYGNLFSLLTVMKGLPLSYNRDMQEDKESLFDTITTLKDTLKILEKLLKKIKFNLDKIEESLNQGYLNATDLAEYLVRKRVPFKKSHEIAGKIVKYCISNDKKLQDLTLKEYRSFSNFFEKDIYQMISLENSINLREIYGGTGRKSVLKQIKKAEGLLGK